MSSPITVDIEIVPAVSVAPDADGAQVLLVAVPGPQAPPGNAIPIFSEMPTGVKDGVNAVFTLAHVPVAGSTAVYRNGLRERPLIGYTVSGADITFDTPPLPDDDLSVDYLIGS